MDIATALLYKHTTLITLFDTITKNNDGSTTYIINYPRTIFSLTILPEKETVLAKKSDHILGKMLIDIIIENTEKIIVNDSETIITIQTYKGFSDVTIFLNQECFITFDA